MDYVGRFKHGAMTEGKLRYSDGSFYEGSFHNGKRNKGKYTFDDGRVFEGEFYSFDLHPKGSSIASLTGLLTFTSEDSRLHFSGDVLALHPDYGGLPRRGKMTSKDGITYDGSWVDRNFEYGRLLCLDFILRFPLAFCEYSSGPFQSKYWEAHLRRGISPVGEYYGSFKDGKFHGWGCIGAIIFDGKYGTYSQALKEGKPGYSLGAGDISAQFKEGKVHGSCYWTKHSFWGKKRAGEIIFRGTVAGGWIWPHVPSVPASEKEGPLWIWPRPAQTGLRFKMNSEVSVNVGNDEWEAAYIKGFITEDEHEDNETGYIVLLESDCHTVLEIKDDSDNFIREVVTDFEVGIESHPDFGYFLLYYSGPIVDGKPRGIGVLTVKHSKCCHDYGHWRYGIPDHHTLALTWPRPPVSYDWVHNCEVEFGLDYAVRGATREYLLNVREGNVAGFPFFDDPPRQLVWVQYRFVITSTKRIFIRYLVSLGVCCGMSCRMRLLVLGNCFWRKEYRQYTGAI